MTQHQGGSVHRFERLSRLDKYEVDKHQIDPRGWDVVGRDGRTVGEVKDLIVDTDRMTARYLDVELDSKLFDMRDDPHVLVPVQKAHRDGSQKRLIVEGLSASRVTELCMAREQHQADFWDRWWGIEAGAPREQPAWAHGGVSPRTEHAVHGDVPRADVQRAIEEVRPGEQVRIPVVKEEIIVERRPVHSDQLATARERHEPAPPRQPRDQ